MKTAVILIETSGEANVYGAEVNQILLLENLLSLHHGLGCIPDENRLTVVNALNQAIVIIVDSDVEGSKIISNGISYKIIRDGVGSIIKEISRSMANSARKAVGEDEEAQIKYLDRILNDSRLKGKDILN